MSMTSGPTTRPSLALRALLHRITGDPHSPYYVPGVVLVIAQGARIAVSVADGTDAQGAPLTERSIFPLASASKLAPGLAILRLLEQGRLALDDPLERHLPEARAARAGVTLRALLCHTSGLPLEFAPGQVEYGPSTSWASLGDACLQTPLAHPPRTLVQYSNVAYGLLGLIIEAVTGLDYRTAIEQLVFEPFGIEAYVGRPGPRPHAMVMDVDSPFAGTDLEPFNSAFSQHLVMPWSHVYSTAKGLLDLVRAYGGSRPDLLRPETAAEARTDQAGGVDGGFRTTDPFIGFAKSKSITWSPCPWGLTVEVKGSKRPHWTPLSASPGSFGQIGSSGCLAWCDPVHDVSWAVLGARTTDNGWLLRFGGALGSAALNLGSDAA